MCVQKTLGGGFYSMIEPGKQLILAVPSRVPPLLPPPTMATSFATDAYIFKRNSPIDEPEDTEVQVLREQRGGQLVCDGIFKKLDQKGLRGSAAGHQEV